MSLAWEVTTDDVANVLRVHGVAKSDGELDQIHAKLDEGEIEKAALRGDDLEQQANYAGDEIEDQLIALGVLPAGTQKKWLPS